MIIASHSSWNGEVLRDNEDDAEVLSKEILEWSVEGSPEEDIVVFDDRKGDIERKEEKGESGERTEGEVPANVSDEECGRQFSVPTLDASEILSLSGVGLLEWNHLGGTDERTDETGVRPRPYAVAASCKVWFIGNSR